MRRPALLVVFLWVALRGSALAAAAPDPPLALSPAQRAWVAAHPLIRIQMARASVPFEFRDADGRPQGLSYDILQLACARLGLGIQVTPLTWPQALAEIQRPTPGVDLLVGVTGSDERRGQMLLTDTYTRFPYVIFTAKSHPFVGGLGDLLHATMAVEKDDVMESWLRRDLPEARILALPENRLALEAVAEGRADAYVGNLAIGSQTIERLGLVNLKVAAPAPYGQDAYSFGVRRDWPQLVELLNLAIASLTPAEAAALRLRWLQVRYEHGLRRRDLLLWLGLGAALAAAFIAQLRRMVRDRTAALADEVKRRSAAEKELRGSLARELDVQRQLADMLEFLPDATLVLDAGHKVLAWNRAMESLTGLPKEQVLGLGNQAYAPAFYGQERPVLADFVLDGQPLPEGSAPVSRQGRRVSVTQFLPLLRQGRGAWLSATASPLLDRQGRVVGAIESIRDITEQRALEAQLAQAQRLEAIGTLAAGIAHDFNNILTAVGGYAELSLARDPDPLLKQDLQGIARATARAAELVRQILAFSRVQPEAPRPLRPQPLVAEALKLLRATIPAGVLFEAELQGEGVVLADPAEIHRMVVNLGSNAALAMQGRGHLRVTLRDVDPDAALRAALPGLRPGPQALLQVQDNGCGMPADVLARAFDPFFTTRPDSGGTGMGLAVVHGIVSSRGGAIKVDSAPGQGTCISVYLPLVQAQPDEAPAPAAAQPAPAHGHLMLVDDEPMLVEVMGRGLTARGWQVEAFTEPREALERLRQAPQAFDLLITDKTMPGLGGPELAIRAKSLRPGLPVILCTGYDDSAPAQGLEGVDHVLHKPVGMDELDAEIRRLLD
jgi:PAS domain S-box-containing protein